MTPEELFLSVAHRNFKRLTRRGLREAGLGAVSQINWIAALINYDKRFANRHRVLPGDPGVLPD